MNDDSAEITPLEKAYGEALTAARNTFIDAIMADESATGKNMHVGLMCILMGELTHVLGALPPPLAQRYIDLFCENAAEQVAISRAEREADQGATVQ